MNACQHSAPPSGALAGAKEWWFRLNICFVACFLTHCAALPDEAPVNRLRLAKKAYEAGDIEKASYYRMAIIAELERGRQNFEKHRMPMARSAKVERLLDPPVHVGLFNKLDDSLNIKEITDEEHLELHNGVRILQAEWGKRRIKVTQDRKRWGF